MAAPEEYLFNTALKWNPNGDLSTRDQQAAHALVMVADRRPFTLTPTQPMTYVALIADATGRWAHVYGNANSWANFVDQLEDIGCNVIENETEDYEGVMESIQEDCIPIQDLIRETDFVSFA
jgi:hypothetical protein